MSHPAFLHRFIAVASMFSAVLVASGCGGGGTGADMSPAAVDAIAPAQAAAVNTSATATTANTTQVPASEDDALAAAMAAQDDAAATAQALAVPVADSSRADAAAPAVAAAVSIQPMAHALAVTAPVMSRLAATTQATTGNVYYVDSRIGNDRNTGTAATLGTAGIGPWRSLAKLALVGFAPGDTIRLVCGSTWRETLKLNASGTVGNPITIAAYPSACASPPAIDGSVSIAPASWVLYKGNIYRTPLGTAPQQLKTSSGQLDIAHHPNRGFDATRPNSLYLRNAVNSNSITIGGRAVSTYLTTGPDLKLPAGATLPVGTAVRIRTNSWALDETTLSAVRGTKLSLATPTSYPLLAGWGYYLMGQL